MSYHADTKLSLNTSCLQPSQRGEETRPSGRRRATSNFSSFSSSFFTSSSRPASIVSISTPQAPGHVPLGPIDSEIIPPPLEVSPDADLAMYKVPGQNVYFIPFGSSPVGVTPSPTHAPYGGVMPSQQFYADASSSRGQRFVMPRASYDTESEEDAMMMDPHAYASDTGDRRTRRVSRSFFSPVDAEPTSAFHGIESRVYTKMDSRHRPPPCVSPASSSATDDSGRSSSYGSTGSGHSVRWHDDLVQPTPPPNKPRPKGFNRRGDQLWTNAGHYKPAVEEYPPYLRDYPDVGEGWMNEHGVRISMSHRRIPDPPPRPLKGVLKNNVTIGF
ncbi:SubName: Full=Uncharacterized protein {ECO:0000313/EMBL:CCA66753.1} [Serendipita indica DSM 11827]|uniref:Uncharacterized protein n=1 Tax=Serendipita indica (strain DSM 11827) TaxID=1109443 RepID=G4T629_SERID|nr:SubName: Full=Uncharacterized protein {ECO:0000313/EMBL:CCA66753.1} [Serendipita indica DSM 11827]CCA66753.1 hypothetical protein PIIN_00434 [Serendipita indica DSM 11827]